MRFPVTLCTIHRHLSAWLHSYDIRIMNSRTREIYCLPRSSKNRSQTLSDRERTVRGQSIFLNSARNEARARWTCKMHLPRETWVTRRALVASRWQMGCPQERSRRSGRGETLGRSSVAWRRDRGRQLKKEKITCPALKVGTRLLDAAGAREVSQGRCEGDEWADVSVSDSPLNAMSRIRSVAVSRRRKHALSTCRCAHVHAGRKSRSRRG